MEVSFDIIVPAAFVGVSAIVMFVGMAFAKRHWARELEQIRMTASLLGLELKEGLDAVKELYDEEGQARFAAGLAKLPKPILRFLAMGAQWRLEGEREGVRVSIHAEARQSGKNSTTYTVVRAYAEDDAGFALSVTREGAFFKLGKALFGLEEVQLDDPELDPKVKIKAQDASSARALLCRDEVRRSLLDLCAIKGDFRLSRDRIQWERQGVLTDAAELGAVLDLLLPIARAFGE